MNNETHSAGYQAITAEQLKQYEETGLLFMRGAIAESDATEMREHLWRGLTDACRVKRDDAQSWPHGKVTHLQSIQGSAFAKMGSQSLCAALDTLFGPGGWQRPSRWGDLLVNFPTPGSRWNVPNQTWHFDVAGSASPAPVAIAFAFLETTQPGGGGTPVVMGSHRLLHKLAGSELPRLNSPRARRLLTRPNNAWINGLWASEIEADRTHRYMERGAVVDGIELKVAEICGAPGDVVIMHPHVLHTVAVNSHSTPRLVLRQNIYGKAPMTGPAIS